MPYPAYVPSCGLTPPRTGKRSAAGRSGAIPAIVPDGGINALSGLRSLTQAHTPQDRQAQRRRAGHFKLRTCGCAGWRHKCLIRPTFLPAGSPPRTGKRSAAGRSGAVPAVVPDAGINALSGLRSFPQAHTPVGPASAAPPGSWPRPTPSVHRQAQGQILRVGIKIVLRLQVAIRILGQIVLKQRQRGEDRQQPGAIVEDHLPQLAALAAV